MVLAAAMAAAHDDYARQMLKWRAERVKDLKSDWLPLVGLHWLEEGENTVGRARGNKVELMSAAAPERLGVITRRGDELTFVAEKGVRVASGGKPVQRIKLVSAPPGPPTELEAGTLSMFLIKRGERYALRVKDSASPAIAKFRGLQYFPVRGKYRVSATWAPTDKKLAILNVVGDTQQVPAVGEARFTLDGQEFRLYPIANSDGTLFFILSDLTKKAETYPAGRYLDTPAPKDGRVELDFNKLYNPPCAFTPYATCPLPPKENQLQVRIEAGEQYSKQ